MISKTLPVNVIDFLFCKGDVKTAKTVDDIDKAVKIEDNIIINFETTIVNLLSNLNNKLETDKPFILFNFPKENFNFLETFKNFKYPQYISYLILR